MCNVMHLNSPIKVHDKGKVKIPIKTNSGREMIRSDSVD
jgi:hypothetical protein